MNVTINETIIGRHKAAIAAALEEAAFAAKVQGKIAFTTLPAFVVEMPREATHGDFATNIAMTLAKEAKANPRAIAETIIACFDNASAGVAEIKPAGPGFINFRMAEGWLADVLAEIVAQGEDFGKSKVGKGQKIQIEFVSANPTGELHMGNARGAAIGDTLASLLTMAGFTVEREFYINDAGNQIEKFGLSLEARYLQVLGRDVPFPEDGYHGEDITDTMRQLAEEEGDKYLALAPEKRREILTAYALDKKLTDIRETLAAFGVVYDKWFSEQSLHDSGAINNIITKLQAQDWTYEEDGALWLDCVRFGEEKDEVLIRANGVPTYFAADIAYHDDKFRRGFDQVIDIWGADHHGHVARMKGAMEAIGYNRDMLEIVLMQFVRLYQNGEILKMSKRTGKYVTLEELIEEVGVDAARFFFVMRSPDSLIDFDLDLAKSNSADNPVYYVQYAHARICSILAMAAAEGYEISDQADFRALTDPSEQTLIRKMADFPDEVIYGALNREPHRITAYLQELAGDFHNFYAHCRVLGEDKKLSNARLLLIKGVAGIIKTALNAIGVNAPEKM